MVFGLVLPPSGAEDAELESSEAVVTPSPSGQTPSAKRQRRLTLTAMTGLICQLSEECPKHVPGSSPTTKFPVDAAEASPECASTGDAAQPDGASYESQQPRESSPLKRLKRSRASISVTASAEVMAAQAAKTLTATSPTKQAGGDRSSDSSDSTEDEEDSLALRVRRAHAFECGALTVTGSPSPAQSSPIQQAELSPRSKLAFDRGVRAAQVAAKVAANMMVAETAPKDKENQSGANGVRPRVGA